MGPTTGDVLRERWQRIKRVAGEALDQPAADRDAFVGAQCGEDEWLRAEVRSLLASMQKAAALYETPMLASPTALAALASVESGASSVVGRRIGSYKVVRELGHGGMGTAYLAERDDQAFELRVAIKLIKRGMDTDAIVRRFRHERQILANLNHPNIGTLLDGGTTDDGRPYFVMEYIDGLPIDKFCERQRLPLCKRLELFQAVCEAVQYAHDQHIVHRDLKPGNILVTTSGVPKLLDFGIAKLLGSDGDGEPQETTSIARAMTPEYASPEQLRGLSITPASDVYSLGVLLYVLLTGRLPYPIERRTPAEVERMVWQHDPLPPSEVIGDRKEEFNRRELRGGLDAIALTALRKEPEQRYPTARALADDIGRHLAGTPTAARHRGLRDRLVTAARRSRTRVAILTLASVLAASLLLAAGSLAMRRWSPAPPPIESIAVLPLVNASGDPEIDFVAEGMTENLIKQLSRLPLLKVIGRDSVSRYKDQTVDPADVGRRLDVQAVLTGHIESRGVDLDVSLDLVDARSRRPIWAGRANRRIDALQALQREIADTVVKALNLSFSGQERTRAGQAFSAESDAYLLYLKGRYVWNKRTASDFRKSIDFFRQAIDKDPRFALAYSGLADAHGLLTEYHSAPAAETYSEAKRAATTALALDEGAAEAHTSLAYVKHFYEWDWAGAEQEFTRALELDPNYATAHQWYAEFLSATGRHDEALASIRRAEQLEPLSLIVNAMEAYLLYIARRYDEAIDKGQKIVEMDSGFPEVHEILKRSYDRKGLYAQAIAARQTRRRLLGRNAAETPALRAAAATTDPTVYWRNRLAQELEEGKNEGLQPFEMAELLAQVGETARALDWLEKACAEHDFMVMYIRVAPNLDPLRHEPRFRSMLDRRCGV